MGAHVLVIEDHPANLQLMEYLLRAFGHRVSTAATGELGLERARTTSPDLIICDIQLPGIDGYEVVSNLKTVSPIVSAPAVAVTAYAMAGDRQRLLGAGFDGYISKPIAPETFVTEIETFLPPALHGRMAAASPGSGERPGARLPALSRILAVDDSPVNLAVLRSILEPRGYDVTVVGDIASAMARAIADPPDLILSDVHMAAGDGFSLLARVQSATELAGIPFAFISSTMLEPSEEQRAIAAGAVDFIRRPIDPEDLFRRVTAILDGR